MRGRMMILMALPLCLAALFPGKTAGAAGMGMGVEAGGGPAGGGADPSEVLLKQAAAATGQADLVVVVKVTEIAEPKAKEAAEKKEEENPNAGVAIVRIGGMQPAKEKLISAEVSDVLRGDKEAKTVRIKANVMQAGQAEYLVLGLDREFKDPNGNVQRKWRQQYTLPMTLAKGKSSLVFLKVAEEKKDDAGKVVERSYSLLQPVLDGAPEKAVAAVKAAVKQLEEWSNPPKLSAEDEAAVARLIKQLGDNDYAVREAATKALSAKGPAVRALVEAATKSEDPEIKQRAAQVLEAVKPESLKPAADPSSSFPGMGGGIMLQGGAGVVQFKVQVAE